MDMVKRCCAEKDDMCILELISSSSLSVGRVYRYSLNSHTRTTPFSPSRDNTPFHTIPFA